MGSTPTSATYDTIPWSNGDDAWLTSRKGRFHVLPRSQGGTSTWENCVLSCVDCNKRKADRTPEQAGVRLRKQPARPPSTPAASANSAS
ncbi:MAG TPA: HNH endonuclease signature motif containing protein [Pirellulales bacterium]|nr:HNH endonuclease signature motif containing protein [Pirellulales bacterium]